MPVISVILCIKLQVKTKKAKTKESESALRALKGRGYGVTATGPQLPHGESKRKAPAQTEIQFVLLFERKLI